MLFLLLLLTPAAHAIEPYRAEQIQVYRGSSIEPYQADTVRPYVANSVKEQKPAPMIQPEAGRIVERQGVVHLNPAPAASVLEKAAPINGSQGAKSVIGIWQTNIPGVVYTSPSGLPGYDILHVSTGAAAGLLRINANGTYTWNSYGGKKGKWMSSNDPEYPIEIIDTVENRRWRVGYNASKGVLYVWDGSIWYEGRKAKVGKK